MINDPHLFLSVRLEQHGRATAAFLLQCFAFQMNLTASFCPAVLIPLWVQSPALGLRFLSNASLLCLLSLDIWAADMKSAGYSCILWLLLMVRGNVATSDPECSVARIFCVGVYSRVLTFPEAPTTKRLCDLSLNEGVKCCEGRAVNIYDDDAHFFTPLNRFSQKASMLP